jgi:hypothetical protein
MVARTLLIISGIGLAISLVLSLPTLAVLSGVVLVGSGLAMSARRSRELRAQVGDDDISPNDRVYLRPIRRLRDEIEAIVLENERSPAVKVIGREAIQEANQLFDHCVALLKTRSLLRKALMSRGNPDTSIMDLDAKIEEAQSDEERSALELARDARKLEAQHYEKIDQTLARVDTSIQQAQAALSEMKARISVAASGGDGQQETEIQDTISRLRSLSTSFDEVEDLMRVHI